MNLVIANMKKRQSVRLFEQKPIPKDIINTIIEAGNLAPSTGDTKEVEEGGKKRKIIDYQPWRFVVVEDPEFKQKLFQTIEPLRSNFYEGLKETIPEMYEQAMKLSEVMEEPKDLVFYSAPIIIYVIGPARNSIGCAMVCENIMLAAVSFGLGSCYVGFGAMVKGNAEVVQALELTDDERIYGPIVFGYPKVNPSERQVSILAELRSKKKDPVIKWI
ncbi:MAG: nitroreductase family protein [Candidatus Bathyarchaeota archaeon]|nr:nitroreductase family protein [Candidatus Bathyarchaeota archaeon]